MTDRLHTDEIERLFVVSQERADARRNTMQSPNDRSIMRPASSTLLWVLAVIGIVAIILYLVALR